MTKALIKKQLREMLSLFIRSDNKKKKSLKSMILYAILMCYCVVVFFGLFYSIMSELCPALLGINMGWLYFAFSAIIATVLAVVGSVFMAQSQLYNAKDNEFLLAMPIPPSKILFSRMISLYIQNFFFEALVFVPTLLVYFMETKQSIQSLVFCILLLFLLPIFSLTITCVLGWFVALISAHMRNKSLITVLFSLGFFAGYYYLFMQLSNNIQTFIANSNVIGEKIKSTIYPIYQMGLGAQGDVKGFVIFAAMVIVLFAVVYIVLSKSFIKIATLKRGEKKVRYKEKTLKISSKDKALYKKELSHFIKSPIYMLNCGLGAVFLVVMAVALIIERDTILSFKEALSGFDQWIGMIGCGMISLVASMNVITAPSVSLEGKNLWILQAMPVSGWKILCGKLKLHMIVTAPVSVVCSVVMAILFSTTPIMSIILIVTPIVFIFFSGVLGLLFNLKFPKLDWNNEAIAVKQSLSVILTMFSGWGIIAAFVIIYILWKPHFGEEIYMILCTLILLAVSSLIVCWLKKRGAEIIETL